MNPEAAKYTEMWQHEEYRIVAPGEVFAPMFLAKARPRPGSRVIDFGCGTGRGGALLASLGQQITMIDFTDNCLDESIKRMIAGPDGMTVCGCRLEALGPMHLIAPKSECPFCDGTGVLKRTVPPPGSIQFIKADLEEPIPVVAEYGFCSDVMEHIPPDKVDRVLDNILAAAQNCWFSICLIEDSCGKLIGETLHLSVHPYDWWKKKLEGHNCRFLYAEDQIGYGHFYVTAWNVAEDVMKNAQLNTEEKQIIENVKTNIARGFMQVSPHVTNDFEVMILGGGPSLNDYVDEIRRNRADGVKLLTLNGSYNWALNHGLTPSATIVVDARPFNKRFVEPVKEDCVYLVASQVDPPVLDNLPTDRTYLWHTMAEQLNDILLDQYGVNNYWPIPGGSTVLSRSFPLMRMLGYKKFILYGCDSCLAPDEGHHAYDQPENNAGYKVPVILNPGGRIFYGTLWMISQAHEFIDTIRYLGDEIDVDVKGDGLLANILKVGAEECDLRKLDE